MCNKKKKGTKKIFGVRGVIKPRLAVERRAYLKSQPWDPRDGRYSLFSSLRADGIYVFLCTV